MITVPENNDNVCMEFRGQGACVQSQICAVRATVSSPYSFGNYGHSWTSYFKEYKNYFIDSTISCCGREGVGYSIVYLQHGALLFDRNNISDCLSAQNCCFSCAGNDEKFPEFKFSTCFNNTASDSMGIFMGSANSKISNSYIIGNNASDFFYTGPLVIENSIIKGNLGDPIFNHDPDIDITLVNSICENENDNFTGINTENMKTTKFVFRLIHIETNSCEADYMRNINFQLSDDKTVLKIQSYRRCLSFLNFQGNAASKLIYVIPNS